MPDLAASWVVEERAARVSEVVESVWDWETASLSNCGMFEGDSNASALRFRD